MQRLLSSVIPVSLLVPNANPFKVSRASQASACWCFWRRNRERSPQSIWLSRRMYFWLMSSYLVSFTGWVQLAGKYRNSGQTCVCINRILVQDGEQNSLVLCSGCKLLSVLHRQGFQGCNQESAKSLLCCGRI